MRIIGVIDLMAGRAVHASGGCRHAYRPLAVAGGRRVDGDALTLARWYRDLGVTGLYAADLDAIAGGAEQDAIVRALAAAGPLWLDAGIATPVQARRAVERGVARVVVGLETLPSFSALQDIVRATPSQGVTFSLDLRDGRAMASAESLRPQSIETIAAAAVDAGAESVIVLDVARVGSVRGPDLAVLTRVRQVIPGVELIAGGGIRNINDWRDVASVGCDGVLMATALHGPDGAEFVRMATGERRG